MDRYIEDEIEEIEYFKALHNLTATIQLKDMDEAASLYIVEGYAEKYSRIWHEEINKKELRYKLFHGYA